MAARSCVLSKRRCPSVGFAASTVKRRFHSGKYSCSRYCRASSKLPTRAWRSPFTKRSCAVPKNRSTRPLACGEWAAIQPIPTSPNTPPPPCCHHHPPASSPPPPHMDLLDSPSLPFPHPRLDQQLPQRLLADLYPVLLRQVLGRQRRPKIPILPLHQLYRFLPHRFRNPPLRGPPP